MIDFTPEQKAEMDRRIADAEAAAVKRYDAEAHKFREWINTHPALWAAQRFATVGAILGGLLGWYSNSIVTRLFG